MMTTGWSLYVIALVVLNIGGCVWLLWWTARRRPGDPKPEDTSHTWDGDLTEYNKPLPKWWINLFYITIVFAIGYLAWYPGFGNFAGSAVDRDATLARMRALQRIGDPYTDEDFAQAPDALAGKSELDAVVAYLQGLGRHAPKGGEARGGQAR